MYSRIQIRPLCLFSNFNPSILYLQELYITSKFGRIHLQADDLYTQFYTRVDYIHRGNGRIRNDRQAVKEWPRHPVKQQEYE